MVVLRAGVCRGRGDQGFRRVGADAVFNHRTGGGDMFRGGLQPGAATQAAGTSIGGGAALPARRCNRRIPLNLVQLGAAGEWLGMVLSGDVRTTYPIWADVPNEVASGRASSACIDPELHRVDLRTGVWGVHLWRGLHDANDPRDGAGHGGSVAERSLQQTKAARGDRGLRTGRVVALPAPLLRARTGRIVASAG